LRRQEFQEKDLKKDAERKKGKKDLCSQMRQKKKESSTEKSRLPPQNEPGPKKALASQRSVRILKLRQCSPKVGPDERPMLTLCQIGAVLTQSKNTEGGRDPIINKRRKTKGAT